MKGKITMGILPADSTLALPVCAAENAPEAITKEDGIHPLRDGYVEWWAPVFEQAIADYLG